MSDGPTAAEVVYGLLFANRSVAEWPPNSSSAEDPVSAAFVAAREALQQGDTAQAAQLWQHIAAQDTIERRHVLQAWTFLRALGIEPPSDLSNQALGVIIEMPVETGVDVLAGYSDGTARYINFSGRVAIIDDPNIVGGKVAALIEAGQVVANVIGVWNEPELPPLGDGQARLTMLTPGGLRFGQGPADVLGREPIVQPLLGAGAELLAEIVQLG